MFGNVKNYNAKNEVVKQTNEELLRYELQSTKRELETIKIDRENDAKILKANFASEKQELELKYKKVLSEMEIRRSAEMENLRQEYEAKLLQVKKDAQEEVIEAKKQMQDESYKRLSDQLEKLHTEGNVMTKFMHDLALQHKRANATLEHNPIGYKND